MKTRDDFHGWGKSGRAAWILTFTGRRVWPLDPRPEDICIEDIAHALALTCRFTGHCREFYSVAQHSVLVSHYVEDEGGDAAQQLGALLHDASEAYLPDVARPVKQRFAILSPGEGYVSFGHSERQLMTAICSTFAVSLWNAECKLVKLADVALLLSERRDLLPDDGNDWRAALGAQDLRPWRDTILPWEPKHAEERFLAEFRRLSKEVSRA